MSAVRQAVRAAAGAGVLLLAAACSAAPASRPAGHAAARPAGPGPLSLTAARGGYTHAIVPVYPDAVHLADVLMRQPAQVPAAARGLAGRLRSVDAQLAAVQAFPPRTAAAFAVYRSDAAAVLADLSRPAALRTPGGARRTASDLFLLAQQIGRLGVALGLMPANATGQQH